MCLLKLWTSLNEVSRLERKALKTRKNSASPLCREVISVEVRHLAVNKLK